MNCSYPCAASHSLAKQAYIQLSMCMDCVSVLTILNYCTQTTSPKVTVHPSAAQCQQICHSKESEQSRTSRSHESAGYQKPLANELYDQLDSRSHQHIPFLPRHPARCAREQWTVFSPGEINTSCSHQYSVKNSQHINIPLCFLCVSISQRSAIRDP